MYYTLQYNYLNYISFFMHNKKSGHIKRRNIQYEMAASVIEIIKERPFKLGIKSFMFNDYDQYPLNQYF